MISVITPTLGRSPFFEQTVESVRRLKTEHEHIVVGPRGASMSGKGLRFVEEPAERAGMYGAINAGLDAMDPRSECWTYINDDDVLGEDFEELLSRFTESGADVGYGNVNFVDGSGAVVREIPIVRNSRWLLFCWAHGVPPLTQQGAVVRRNVERFDAGYRLAGDMEYWVRLLVKGRRFQCFDLDTGGFRLNPGQLTSKHYELYLEEMRRIQEAYFHGRRFIRLGRLLARALLMRYNLRIYLRRAFRGDARRSTGLFGES